LKASGEAVPSKADGVKGAITLPPGANVTKVEQLLHDGTTRPLESAPANTPDAPGLDLYIADAATDVMHTVIHYELN